MSNRMRAPILALSVLLVAALACNRGTPTPASPATQAQQTVEAILTASAGAPTFVFTPTIEVAGGPSATPGAGEPPSATPEPAQTEVKPSDTPGPTNTPGAQGCTDSAQYVQDVTVPDNTVFNPGAAFTKTWRLRNNGTCTWVSSYSLAFVAGDAMGGPASVPISGNVAPGSLYDVSVNLVAPTNPNTYKGTWQMRNSGGALFGTKPFVQIVVAAPSATPTNTSAPASATPTPTITATPSGGPWSGSWQTDCGASACGEMSLVQTGNSVVGSYAGGAGIINGTVTGNRLTGTWSRGGDSGTIDFWIGGGGLRWRGNYDKVNTWCGQRAGQSAPSPCGVASWYGTWASQCGASACGDIVLTQDGDDVSGTYAGGAGTVTGTVNGLEYTGNWSRGGSNGTFKFFMLPNSNQFQGNWNTTSEWCGQRNAVGLPAPCLKN